MKILILGNQARSTSNFWTVLMRRMRAAGHEVLCAVPAGDDAAEAAIRAIAAAQGVSPDGADDINIPGLNDATKDGDLDKDLGGSDG